MKANEKPLEAKLRKGVVRLGGLCLKMPAVYFTGIPDRLCLLPSGRLYFVETKSTGKDLSPRQLYVKRQLEGLGFQVFKVDSEAALAEFLRFCKSLLELRRLTGAKASETFVDELKHLEALKAFDWQSESLTASEAVELESLLLCQTRLAELGEELNAKDRASLEKLQSKSI